MVKIFRKEGVLLFSYNSANFIIKCTEFRNSPARIKTIQLVIFFYLSPPPPNSFEKNDQTEKKSSKVMPGRSNFGNWLFFM